MPVHVRKFESQRGPPLDHLPDGQRAGRGEDPVALIAGRCQHRVGQPFGGQVRPHHRGRYADLIAEQAAHADLRMGMGPNNRLFIMNKRDGTIREVLK